MRPVFLDVDDVLLIHAIQIRETGGDGGVRDPGLLDSAVAQPRAGFGGEFLHEDLFAMASAYLFSLANNHPFVDGNKRTALVAALTFLDINGHSLESPDPRLYDLTMGVAEGRIERGQVAEVLRELAGEVGDEGG